MTQNWPPMRFESVLLKAMVGEWKAKYGVAARTSICCTAVSASLVAPEPEAPLDG
jgi:hypothetical protein